MRWKTQRNISFILFSCTGFAIVLFFLIGAVPAKSKRTTTSFLKPVGVDLTKPIQVIHLPMEKKPGGSFDYTILFNVLVLFGSLLAFAFLNGARLGKIENKIDHLQKSVEEERDSRRQVGLDLGSAKERLTRIETTLKLAPDTPPRKVNIPPY